MRSAVVFLACVMLVPPQAYAQFSSPFGRDAIGLAPEEMAEIRGAIRRVLEKYTPGEVQSWKSSKTGRAGEAVLVETFERNGMKCGRVVHRFTAGKGGRTFDAPLCQVADGTWKLAF